MVVGKKKTSNVTKTLKREIHVLILFQQWNVEKNEEKRKKEKKEKKKNVEKRNV